MRRGPRSPPEGKAQAPRRRAVQGAAQARLHAAGAGAHRDRERLRRAHASADLRQRDGFALTDHGTDLAGALDQANYCIWCHEQGKDSCSKGLKEKAPGRTARSRKRVFGVPLAGCPLEEKISEFHMVKARGEPLGALGIIAVDNPMAAATGHRICNDCMKSCIYQKQEPVDIPQAETRTLKDVLELPWGFEIYSLLTRWNPLNLRRPCPKPATGKRVLVVGLGPPGFTLAHHLMNDGHAVVGIDGLKIEPLDADDLGRGRAGQARAVSSRSRDVARAARAARRARDGRLRRRRRVRHHGALGQELPQDHPPAARAARASSRCSAACASAARSRSTTRSPLGFDHVALCAGAGRPTVLEIPNGLARGVRAASDFLMALQLTGAAKRESIANLQIRLPVVVIGGGLTAIDTATESLAYYPVQVEKFLARYEALGAASRAVERRGARDRRGIHRARARPARARSAAEDAALAAAASPGAAPPSPTAAA